MTQALKRAASVFLAILLLFLAFAAPVTQPVKAVAVSAVVISAVLAAMAVWGISTITAGMTAADIQDWVSTKLNDWATSKSSTVASLIPINGISVTATALLVLGNGVANAIKDFVSWLTANESLQPGIVTNVAGEPSSYGGVQMGYYPDGVIIDWLIAYDLNTINERIVSIYGTPVYGYTRDVGNGNWYTSVFSQDPFVIVLEEKNSNGVVIDSSTRGADYNEQWGYYSMRTTPKKAGNYDNPAPLILMPSDVNNLVDIRNAGAVQGNSLSLDTDVSFNLPVDLVDSESLYLNTGAAIGATVEGVTDHVITGVVENTLDVTGTIAEEAPAYEVTGPVQVPGIKDIFPFCIPFDLYAFLACLAAEPEAPAFTWRIYVPGIVDEEIEVDLAPFNTVATILRTGLLLLFCVGLAFETRKLLRS